MRRYLYVFFSCLLFVPTLFSQEQTTGFPPFGSFQDGQFDSMNLQNLNANFSIPIVSSPGRGSSFGFAVNYNSIVWYKYTFGSTTSWHPVSGTSSQPTWGWDTNYDLGLAGAFSYQSRVCNPNSANPEFSNRLYNFKYVAPNGTVHPFGMNYYTDATSCHFTPTGPTSGYATDNSGFFLNMTPSGPIVTTPDGSKLDLFAYKVTDPNGNFSSPGAGGYLDSAGHTAMKVDTTVANQITYQYPDTTGTFRSITLKFQTYNIKTNFGCSGVGEYTGTASLPYEMDLPNSTKYLFEYEDTPSFSGYKTARLKKVTLPSGGYYQYTYTGANGGIQCSDGTPINLTRTINDGTTSNAWTYQRMGTDTYVTAPQLSYDSVANQTNHSFNVAGQETATRIYQGSISSGTLLRTIYKTWSGNTPSAIKTVYEDNTTQAETDYNYDSYGEMLSLTERDLGTVTTPGAIVRTTTNTYSAGLFLLTQQIVKDGSNVVQSRTDIAYNEPAYINTVCPPGAAQHDDTNYGCSYTNRGLPTTVTTYTDPVTPSGAVARHFTYDWFGNVRTAELNCCQKKTSAYSSVTQYAYPDSVTSGSSTPQLTTSATYNQYTGQVVTSTDENNKQTTFEYDLLNRLKKSTRSNGTEYLTTFDDIARTVTSKSPLDGTNFVVQVISYDGLGRGITSALQNGSGTTFSITKQEYDALGGIYRSSNPYTTSPSDWTNSQMDGLGRTKKTTLPDGSQTSYSYSTNSVTVTDPAGKQRKTINDGLGRVSSVFEPDVTSGNTLTVATSYAYTSLDALKTVTQGAQTRSFVYDALGRLTTATLPESGQTQFTYDNYNLLATRTDARGVVTTYTYDSLNRLYQISYNVTGTGVAATPTVTYAYGTTAASNNNGRLIGVTDGTGSESYTYNSLGQVTQLSKVVGSTTYNIGYSYNLAGALITLTYPSGRVVQTSFDNLGRLCAVGAAASTCTTGTVYANGFAYNTAQQVTAFTYGNGVAANFGYSSDRLQLTTLSYAKGASTLLSESYTYGTVGNNNGQLTRIVDNVEPGRSRTFTYDALMRLSSAVTDGSTAYPRWGLTWTYDRYGNRPSQAISAGCIAPMTCPVPSYAVTAATNRLTAGSYAYDASGNLTNDGANTLAYDAEGRTISSSGAGGSATYSYDGNGLRVKKVDSVTTVYIFSGGKDIAEYDSGAAPGSPSKEFIYASGTLIMNVSAGTTSYFHPDGVSNRVLTSTSGSVTGQRGHFPFGETWYESGSTKWKFTTYERDTESGNDYAMARYYANRLGRFSSPDPLAGSILDPQSLNRYSYTQNEPIDFEDPTGLVRGLCTDADTRCRAGGGGPDDPQLYRIMGGFTFGSTWNEFDILEKALTPTGWADNPGCRYKDDCPSGEPPYFPLYGNAGVLGLLGQSDGAPDLPTTPPNVPDPATAFGPPPAPPLPFECRPEFIAAARAAWIRAGAGLRNTEGGFVMRGSPANPVYVPLPTTNEANKITFKPSPNDIALFHTHPYAASQYPSPPPSVDFGYFRPGDKTFVPGYTATSKGLFLTSSPDPIRKGLDWLNPCF